MDIAYTLGSIGLAMFNTGAYHLAKNCFSNCLRTRANLVGADHRDNAILWYNLATISLEEGDTHTAILL